MIRKYIFMKLNISGNKCGFCDQVKKFISLLVGCISYQDTRHSSCLKFIFVKRWVICKYKAAKGPQLRQVRFGLMKDLIGSFVVKNWGR